MDVLLLRAARLTGALPFHLRKDGRTPAFRWLSCNAVAFVLVATVWHAIFVNNVGLIGKEIKRYDVED